MQLFIIPEVEKLTLSYHQGGTVAIIAPDIDSAKGTFASHALTTHTNAPEYLKERHIEITNLEWETAIVYNLGAKHRNSSNSIHIFPNEGCC